MIRVLPFIVELVLVVYCLLDLSRADESRIRTLPRWAWAVAMIVIPILGCLAWLVAGRPLRNATQNRPTATDVHYEQPPQHRTTAPDDDPEFLRGLQRSLDQQRREDERRRQQEEPPEPS